MLISTSPREALKLFASCHVDAVVLDYQMPEMCGDVVASRMKQVKPDIPIMLLSGHDALSEEDVGSGGHILFQEGASVDVCRSSNSAALIERPRVVNTRGL